MAPTEYATIWPLLNMQLYGPYEYATI
ncbi:hypothetical protein CCACVL1_02173 [Corchorus capsularis]|uniref:Uncharacterized protein n=1 Tax=Corchorus capsularis TaxID=210143 RepID=A0A1R3KB35_COCAP|nr:hypothetical protein CCACVL1_02173 [Corchorus capsularis]